MARLRAESVRGQRDAFAVQFAGESVEPGRPIVFWSDGDKRCAIISGDYRAAKATLYRVISRFRHGVHRQFIEGKVGEMMQVGQPVTVYGEGRQTAGLVRPFVVPGALDADEPFMIAIQDGPSGRDIFGPVVVPNRDMGRAFVRRVRERRSVPFSRWIGFDTEIGPSDAEVFFHRPRGGPVVVRTVLELELMRSLGRQATMELPPLHIDYGPITDQSL